MDAKLAAMRIETDAELAAMRNESSSKQRIKLISCVRIELARLTLQPTASSPTPSELRLLLQVDRPSTGDDAAQV